MDVALLRTWGGIEENSAGFDHKFLVHRYVNMVQEGSIYYNEYIADDSGIFQRVQQGDCLIENFEIMNSTKEVAAGDWYVQKWVSYFESNIYEQKSVFYLCEEHNEQMLSFTLANDGEDKWLSAVVSESNLTWEDLCNESPNSGFSIFTDSLYAGGQTVVKYGSGFIATDTTGDLSSLVKPTDPITVTTASSESKYYHMNMSCFE